MCDYFQRPVIRYRDANYHLLFQLLMAPLTPLTGIVAQQDSSSSTQSQQDTSAQQHSPNEQQQSANPQVSPSSPQQHQQSSSSSSHLTDSLLQSQHSSQHSAPTQMEQKDEAVPAQIPYYQQSSPLHPLTSGQSDMQLDCQPTYQQLQPLTLDQQQPAQQNHDSSMSTGKFDGKIQHFSFFW